jgi:hypothetical protein
MPIEKTPPLLQGGTEAEYIKYLQEEYRGKRVVIPEGPTVIFFLNSEDDCQHFLCGKGKKIINPLRAQYLLFIRYILETKEIRQIKRHLDTGNIVFYCEELSIVIICAEMKKGSDWRCFTYHPVNGHQKKELLNPNKYIDIAFN